MVEIVFIDLITEFELQMTLDAGGEVSNNSAFNSDPVAPGHPIPEKCFVNITNISHPGKCNFIHSEFPILE